MRLLKSGYVLYRMAPPRFICTSAQPLPTGGKWATGTVWRTKVLLKHPRRATWREFLPLVGLLLTMALG